MLTDQLKERKMSAWNGDLCKSLCWCLMALLLPNKLA